MRAPPLPPPPQPSSPHALTPPFPHCVRVRVRPRTPGSTHTFTPRQFVDDLKVLELGGVGSRALPNGLRDPQGGKRAYQDYYDELYFTRDAPPPAQPPPQQQQQRQAPAPKLSRPSPVPSQAGSAVSVGTVSSAGLGKEDKKDKKKKGLFKW